MVERSPAAYPLKKGARLRKRTEFLTVQNKGTKFRSKHFILAALKEGPENTRLGITVTTKVNKRASNRNLLKRRVRELYRLERGVLNELFPGFCGVVIGLQGSTELGFDEIRSELCFLIRKAKKQFCGANQ